MKASYSSIPQIKIFTSDAFVDRKYFIGLFILTTIAISTSYFLKKREKNKNDYK